MTQKLKICGVCGGKTFAAFTNETFTIGGEVPVHGLSGERCAHCGEVYFDQPSQDHYVDAGNAWVLARKEKEKMHVRVLPVTIAP